MSFTHQGVLGDAQVLISPYFTMQGMIYIYILYKVFAYGCIYNIYIYIYIKPMYVRSRPVKKE